VVVYYYFGELSTRRRIFHNAGPILLFGFKYLRMCCTVRGGRREATWLIITFMGLRVARGQGAGHRGRKLVPLREPNTKRDPIGEIHRTTKDFSQRSANCCRREI
jgi:hypothetical protein